VSLESNKGKGKKAKRKGTKKWQCKFVAGFGEASSTRSAETAGRTK
jgi:hypothetical protein